MKSFINFIRAAVCLLPIAGQASQIVDVSALSSTGTFVSLGAGTYQVSVIGTAQGGAYNAWNFASINYNTPSAAPAPNTWVDSFVITIDGASTAYYPLGNPIDGSSFGALATYQNSVLYANGTTPASQALNTVFFTLASSQAVNFMVSDYVFADNWGGISLSVTPAAASAAPEPSTLAMLGLAFAGGIAALRRERSAR